MSTPRRKRVLISIIAALWISAIGAGARTLLRYSYTPGQGAAEWASRWPAGASIQQAPGRATLVLFVHPQCPCSKSTIEELARIVAHSLERVNGYVFFYSPEKDWSPEEKPRDWARTGLWQSAAIIPGVRAMEDPDGREARR